LMDTRWGLFSLNASRWLLARTWTASRNKRGDRQGAAALQSWLPTFIAEEGRDLQLKRYQQQPEDLAEQLPRIERLLLWLHLARNVLEVAETDRLFGELNKLAELAKRPLSPEELEPRMTQAQILMSLKPWKTLLKNG
jgi:triphosphatase